MRIRILTGVTALVAGLAVIAASGASATGSNPHIAIKPASQNVELGSGDFTIDVEVEHASNVGAFEVMIEYDPDIIEYKGVVEGPFIDGAGGTKFCAKYQHPDGNAVQFGCGAASGNPSGASGSGLLATFTFAPKAAGTSELLFKRASLVLPDNCQTSDCISDAGNPTVADGAVRVYQPGQEPDDLPDTPEPDSTRLTPTAVVGGPTEESLLLTPVAGNSGNSRGNSSGNNRGGNSNNSNRNPRSGVAGNARSGASGAAAGDQNFPVAGHGQQQDADSTGLWIGIGLVGAGVVLLGSGGRIMARRRAGE